MRARLRGVVLAARHGAEVRNERVEIGRGEIGMGGHVAVAEGLRIVDVGLDLLRRPVLDDALRHVQVGTGGPALAIDRMTGDALAAEELEALPGRRVAWLTGRGDVGILLAELDHLELGDLPHPWIQRLIALRRLGPDEIGGGGGDRLRADWIPAGLRPPPPTRVRRGGAGAGPPA